MKEILVGFSRPKGWFVPFSWLIRLGYGTPYSHAYIKFYSETTSRWVIFQASGLNINLISETNFLEKEFVYKEFPVQLSDQSLHDILQFAIDNLGKPYNLKGVIGIAFVRLCQLIGIKARNPFPYDGSCEFCSELVGYILCEFDGMDIDNKDYASISPKDMFEFMNSLPAPSAEEASQP